MLRTPADFDSLPLVEQIRVHRMALYLHTHCGGYKGSESDAVRDMFDMWTELDLRRSLPVSEQEWEEIA